MAHSTDSNREGLTVGDTGDEPTSLMVSLAEVLSEQQDPTDPSDDLKRPLMEDQHRRGNEQGSSEDGIADCRITAGGRLDGFSSDDEFAALELAEDGVEPGRGPCEDGQ